MWHSLPAPQISVALPVQAMLQSDSVVLCEPLAKKSPQSANGRSDTSRARRGTRLTALLCELGAGEDEPLAIAERDTSLVGHRHCVGERRGGKCSSTSAFAVEHAHMSAMTTETSRRTYTKHPWGIQPVVTRDWRW